MDIAPRPFANTYWVERDRLLAGEHPGHGDAALAADRIGKLLALGMNAFIDLTQPDEVDEYANLLLEPARRSGHVRIEYRRFSITDHGLPPSSEYVTGILDHLDDALARGRKVYLHCRAGVGRTGTILACYFIRRGLDADDALDRLAGLWRQSERSAVIPQIPETRAQHKFVRRFSERRAERSAPAIEVAAQNSVSAALLGLAHGESEALHGAWGADTMMTLLLGESLAACRGIDLADQMRRYLAWQQTGTVPGAATAVPIPAEVQRALATWQWTRKPWAGPHDPAFLHPHTLARTTAIAAFYLRRPELGSDAAAEASRTTNQSPVVLDACRYYWAVLHAAINGAPKADILSGRSVRPLLGSRPLKPQIQAILDGSWQTPAQDDVSAAPGLLSMVLRAFAAANRYEAGLSLVLAHTSHSSTAGALYGALAGAHYRPALPGVADRTLLLSLAQRLDGTEF